ncbi:MAG: segregation ATPase FtsK/SpoIIIE, family [Mycobacteriales bacterium]
MRFVFGDAGAELECELAVRRPDARVGDLAAALGVPGGALLVDGRWFRGDAGVDGCGLVLGARVVPPGPAAHPAAPAPAAVLQLVGGLGAGRSVPLPVGRTVVGRGSGSTVVLPAVDVSRTHCAIEVGPSGEVTVTDLASRNGTDLNGRRLDAPVRLRPDDLVCLAGEVLLRVVPPGHAGPVQHVNPVREARAAGTIPFNRVPRVAEPEPPRPVRFPEAPSQAFKAPFSVAAMLGPIAMAGAIVALTKNWQFAAIAGLSPLMFLGNFIEERTRGRRGLRRATREYAAKLAATGVELAARHAGEVAARRTASPDLAELRFRAQAPGQRLWERRRRAGDFLRVSVGYADLPWQPPIASRSEELPPDATRLVAALGPLPQVPVEIEVGAGGVVGIGGDRPAALAAARALLCQAVVTSGPADVTVAVFTDPDRLADWDWTKWLPHGADPQSGSARLVAVGAAQADALAKSLLAAVPGPEPAGTTGRPVTLIVVDGAALLEGRPCPLRDLLAGAGPCGGIVLTDRLPALCTSILTVRGDGAGRLERVTTGAQVDRLLVTGIGEPDARSVARALARYEDPELRADGAGLPDRVNLLSLLDLPEVSGAAVANRWRAQAPAYRVGTVLGVAERDLFAIDLDGDGPHGLIAGTTGSGKSELLRTLVAGMAVGASPEQLTFVLIDYKGGGALDECARLPHVVGLVTDLDEHLGERALRCLEAEVRHRERALRAVDLSHVRDYQRLRDTARPELEPMPRLLVLIDEFATLVTALPDFVDSLVSIAQRGRSLGMHLIIATQRPAGSVSDAIKNNVKLRIALRLESTGDSLDVIDNPAAAGIGSRQWGRGYYRVSAREVLAVQTALSTAITPDAAVSTPISVTPFALGADPHGQEQAEGETDLARLVAAVAGAQAAAGFAPPRRPWPEPLPPVLPLADLPPAASRGLQTDTTGLPTLAIADDPDRQSQYPVGWAPEAGNLLVYGAVGAGTSTTLAALALGVAGATGPDRLHLYALDLGPGDLAPLADLPHTGAYIGAGEAERQIRLIRMLRREVDRRKTAGGGTRWLVLIDNLGALLADNDKDTAGMSRTDDLTRVYTDGPTVGIHIAATADRTGAVPAAWNAITQQKLLLRLADPGEYGNFDVPRRAVPAALPGRAVIAATHQVVHIGHPGDLPAAVRGVAARWADQPGTAAPVGVLPDRIALSQVDSRGWTGAEPWQLPLGIGDTRLAPAGLTLYEHEHALITGPSRSGRSLALCTVAAAALAAPRPPAVIVYAPRRSPLRDLPGPVTVLTGYAELGDALAAAGPTLVLVDDAETVEDDQGLLEGWLAAAGPGRHLVAAGRADGIRRRYGGWAQKVRDSRCGVLLVPDHDLDGDLLGITLPRLDRMAPVPGRGYLIANGTAEGIHIALPDPPDPPAALAEPALEGTS